FCLPLFTPLRSLLPPIISYHYYFYSLSLEHVDLHSFPTRRSSDLIFYFERRIILFNRMKEDINMILELDPAAKSKFEVFFTYSGDRKSTRLNSSHVSNSYAVFCLKKK